MAPPRDNTAADTTAQDPEASLAQFVAGYRPLPGVVDEMMDADGQVRPHWKQLLSQLAALGPDEISRRFAR